MAEGKADGSMTDDDKVTAGALATAKQKSLDTLFDYTKFHIGVYVTLTGSYLTASVAKLEATLSWI